jgi:DNA repair exonuclease SbcCD nuclease subunit
MAKLLYVTDVHLKDKPPVSRIDDYAEALFGKFLKLRKLCEKLSIDAFLIGGDLFDVKDSVKVSHYLTRRSIEIFKSFPCPVYSIVGNHDIKYDRLDTISEQPLGVLFESGAVQRLTKAEFGNTEVIGVDFTSDKNTEVSDFVFEKTADEQILSTHHNLFLGKTEFFDEKAISYEQLEKEVNAWLVLCGHIHYPPNGEYIVKVKDTYFVNPGSLSRGSLSKDNLQRPVQAALIDTDEKSVELVNIKAAPPEEIFDLESKQEKDEKSEKIEDFVENLRDAVEKTEGEDVYTILSELDTLFPEDMEKKLRDLVSEKIGHYVEMAGGA